MRKYLYGVIMTLCLMACGQQSGVQKKEAEKNNDADTTPAEVVVDSVVGQVANQNLKVETIAFKHKLDGYEGPCEYSIPKIVATNPDYSSIADSINNSIWSRIFYKEGGDVAEFAEWCRAVSFNSKIEGDYLYIDMDYTGYGNRGEVENKEVLLFDMNSGARLTQEYIHNIVPFSALFTLEGYFDFLNSRKWRDRVRSAVMTSYDNYMKERDMLDDSATILEAHQKACDAQFHIDYSINKEDGMIMFWKESSYFAIFSGNMQCYEVFVDDKCPINDIVPYLSEVGRLVVNKEFSIVAQVEGMKTVDKNLFMEYSYEKTKDVSDDDNTEESRSYYVPCQIAINYSNPTDVKGFLYMEGKKEAVIGSMKGGMFNLRSKQSEWEASISYSEFYDYSKVPF